MGFYVADAAGLMGSIASLGGWRNFREWAPKDGPVGEFLNEGVAYEPAKLAEALAAVSSDRPGTESIRRSLIAYAKRADEILILTDGETDDEEEAG